MGEHSKRETHSQDRPSESSDLWPVLAHNLSRKHCLLSWQLNKQLCVCACILQESAIVFHQADKCLCICVNEHVHMCDRALQRGRLAAWVWTLHASFIPLTSDKAEALLVMMWLLLPIMPRCRLGRKKQCGIFSLSLIGCLWRPTLYCSIMKLFHSVETLYWHTRHWILFTKLLLKRPRCLFIPAQCLISLYYPVKHESITMFTSFIVFHSDSVTSFCNIYSWAYQFRLDLRLNYLHEAKKNSLNVKPRHEIIMSGHLRLMVIKLLVCLLIALQKWAAWERIGLLFKAALINIFFLRSFNMKWLCVNEK